MASYIFKLVAIGFFWSQMRPNLVACRGLIYTLFSISSQNIRVKSQNPNSQFAKVCLNFYEVMISQIKQKLKQWTESVIFWRKLQTKNMQGWTCEQEINKGRETSYRQWPRWFIIDFLLSKLIMYLEVGNLIENL